MKEGNGKELLPRPWFSRLSFAKLRGGKKVLLFSHVKQVPNYPLRWQMSTEPGMRFPMQPWRHTAHVGFQWDLQGGELLAKLQTERMCNIRFTFTDKPQLRVPCGLQTITCPQPAWHLPPKAICLLEARYNCVWYLLSVCLILQLLLKALVNSDWSIWAVLSQQVFCLYYFQMPSDSHLRKVKDWSPGALPKTGNYYVLTEEKCVWVSEFIFQENGSGKKPRCKQCRAQWAMTWPGILRKMPCVSTAPGGGRVWGGSPCVAHHTSSQDAKGTLLATIAISRCLLLIPLQRVSVLMFIFVRSKSFKRIKNMLVFSLIYAKHELIFWWNRTVPL